ncbi:hypothetical protein DY000_02017699 [Brassica cretica]|uniref:Uncharacterized protein n=1 Tax=Brassica cretica TaxID=69181 RepID=A0ABQ7CWM8_BRACR|nr:hypothetical protein DY000_02017699 [Brassica cretica]
MCPSDLRWILVSKPPDLMIDGVDCPHEFVVASIYSTLLPFMACDARRRWLSGGLAEGIFAKQLS